jgi:hypothetical protein
MPRQNPRATSLRSGSQCNASPISPSILGNAQQLLTGREDVPWHTRFNHASVGCKGFSVLLMRDVNSHPAQSPVADCCRSLGGWAIASGNARRGAWFFERFFFPVAWIQWTSRLVGRTDPSSIFSDLIIPCPLPPPPTQTAPRCMQCGRRLACGCEARRFATIFFAEVSHPNTVLDCSF